MNQYDRDSDLVAEDTQLPAFHSKGQRSVGHAVLPTALANMPELYTHLDLVWIMFSMVRNSRFVSDSGVGSISLTEIRAVLDEFQVENDPDLRIYYIRLIQILDGAYVQYIMKARK